MKRSLLVLIALGVLVAGVAIARGQTNSRPTSKRSSVALEGYCPVCIIEAKKWVHGNPQHQVIYDGKTYYFPSENERRMFQANPAKYVPALGGDCTVCYAKVGKRVPGNIRHGAYHGKRLFLFPSDKERNAFLANPKAFADVDLALDGKCAVCRAMAGKDVPGKSEFTVIHEGLRYQFPSAKERRVFLANPSKFAVTSPARKQASTIKDAQGLVTFKGKSTCAGCEHGVTPIGAKDTLGLAINTGDGKVVIVEDAHKLYPDTYKKRFDGLLLQVSGKLLKREGKFSWIQPLQLKVVN